MAEEKHLVRNANAAWIHDDDYPKTLRGLVRSCAHRCWCMIFIVDVNSLEDPEFLVDTALNDLADANWRGVDVRLLIGGSRSNANIRDMTLVARARAQSLGVDTRLVAAREQRSNHCKTVIVDSHVLLGSHNWSPGAFSNQTQDSVWIQHDGLAAWYLHRFEAFWHAAPEAGFDVFR
ncbi:MAG: phospholipase D-like domain-containing protein [Myxococcota bacterium]